MTSTTRPLNDEDRRFLEERRDELNLYGPSIGETLIVFCWPVAVITFVLSFIWIGFCRFFGWLDRAANWNETPLVFWGVAVIFIGTVIYGFQAVILQEIRQMQRNKHKREAIDEEFASNEVEATNTTVVGVKCLQEPEHLMKIYLLKLSDGRVWVRYDYDSVDTDGRGKSPRTKFVVTKEMQFVHFKHLKEVGYVSGTTKIRKPRPSPMNVRPEKWPEDETWLQTPWDEVEATYAN